MIRHCRSVIFIPGCHPVLESSNCWRWMAATRSCIPVLRNWRTGSSKRASTYRLAAKGRGRNVRALYVGGLCSQLLINRRCTHRDSAKLGLRDVLPAIRTLRPLKAGSVRIADKPPTTEVAIWASVARQRNQRVAGRWNGCSSRSLAISIAFPVLSPV